MTRFTHPQWKKMILFLFWVPEIPCSGELYTGIQYSNAVLLVILHFYTICLYWNRIGTKQDYYYLIFLLY